MRWNEALAVLDVAVIRCIALRDSGHLAPNPNFPFAENFLNLNLSIFLTASY
jgi:hypothetical protein